VEIEIVIHGLSFTQLSRFPTLWGQPKGRPLIGRYLEGIEA
jgi:hypothetical protein